jgi:hypothetical protein
MMRKEMELAHYDLIKSIQTEQEKSIMVFTLIKQLFPSTSMSSRNLD